MYLLDANVFITAKNTHYGLDFVPAFWDWVSVAHAAGRVTSVRAVRDELEAGHDELAVWAKDQPATLFMPPDTAALSSMQLVARWATSQSGYQSAATATFLSTADFILVAKAHSAKMTLVTHERPAPTSRKAIKIPDACNAHNIQWLTPFEMLRKENARFVLR